jgi:hypothetical protein
MFVYLPLFVFLPLLLIDIPEFLSQNKIILNFVIKPFHMFFSMFVYLLLFVSLPLLLILMSEFLSQNKIILYCVIIIASMVYTLLEYFKPKPTPMQEINIQEMFFGKRTRAC